MQKQWEVTAIWRSDFPSTVCMNSQHSECFKEALWNVSDSHGESLLQLKCFSKSPRYSLWTLLLGKYGGIFLFIYIKWHVNKETVSTCGSLGVSISVHKWELVCAKKEKIVLWRNKNKNCKDTTKSKDSIYKSENIFFSDAAHHTTSAQSEANRFIPLISDGMRPSKRGLWKF